MKRKDKRPIDEIEADVEAKWARVDELLATVNAKAAAVKAALDTEKAAKAGKCND